MQEAIQISLSTATATTIGVALAKVVMDKIRAHGIESGRQPGRRDQDGRISIVEQDLRNMEKRLGKLEVAFAAIKPSLETHTDALRRGTQKMDALDAKLDAVSDHLSRITGFHEGRHGPRDVHSAQRD